VSKRRALPCPKGQMHGKKSWHRLYKLARWCNPVYGLRMRCLVRDLFTCRACGRVEHSSKLHAHHLIPHKGDQALFWDDQNIATLCFDCHEQVTIEQERPEEHNEQRGYSEVCDPLGYPIDPRHPFNEIRPA
jgi:5-methylcytosine-specific restriction enzyme A